jgi:outer membrane protein assembly factor BamB
VKTVWLNQRTVPGTRFPQSGTPAVIDDRLYLLGAGRVARCVNALTGQDLWSTPLPGEFDGDAVDSSVAVAAGVVVALAGQLVGLDATTGELRWAGPAGKAIGRHSSPVVWQIGGRELIIVNLDGVHTVCIDPSSGNELWRVQSEADRSTPVLVGDRQMLTYGNSRKKGLRSFAISPEGATPQWVYQGAADAGASPVVVGEHCYVQGELRLACVDLQTGKQRWLVELDLGQPRYTSLAAADGKVLYTFDGLLMFAAAADEHRPLVEAKMDKDAVLFEHSQLPPKAGRNKPLECASPALADGRRYLRMRGGVVCYDLRAEPTD